MSGGDALIDAVAGTPKLNTILQTSFKAQQALVDDLTTEELRQTFGVVKTEHGID